MNREIKFRYYDRGEMQFIDDWYMCGPIMSGDIDAPIMQFTGLLDKRGKKIYEGDIVKHHVVYGDNQVKDQIQGDVYWSYDTYKVRCDVFQGNQWNGGLTHKRLGEVADSKSFEGSAKYACEIIGNIYENPELCT